MKTLVAAIGCIFNYYLMTIGWGLAVHSLGFVLGFYTFLLVPAILLDLAAMFLKDVPKGKP